jgi:surfeit locus 1 family protein
MHNGWWLVRMFSRRWLLATLLVVAGTAVLIRLGIWQLDRLDQRRAFNARVLAQQSQPVLILDAQSLSADHDDFYDMEYRPVTVHGTYDFTYEVALRNQAYESRYGLHLLTPLRIEGTDWYVIIDRGWVPLEGLESDLTAESWQPYAEPGLVTVSGILRRAQPRSDYNMFPDPPGELLVWNLADIARMAEQMPFTLLQTAYVQQAPDLTYEGLPARSQPDLDLSEGPHFSYALQWFSFAALLFFGYPFFVLREERTRPTARTRDGS